LDTDRDRAVEELIGGASGDAKGHYAKFARGLKGWSVFESAASSDKPHWFQDLLKLWRPSGHCSGVDGLRVAIRDGYLNFYRLGQSIARVECVSGRLIADVHYKFMGLPGTLKLKGSPLFAA
jgi:hypothetical protein